jgi:hypothetical protein
MRRQLVVLPVEEARRRTEVLLQQLGGDLTQL